MPCKASLLPILCLALALNGLLPRQSPAQPIPTRMQAEQLFVQGMTRAFVGEHQAAIQLYRQAIALVPDDASLHAAVAESFAALERLPEAIPFARTAVTLSPDRAEGYLFLAQLEMMDGDAVASEATLSRLLEREPAHLDALYELAFVQQTRGADEAAIATYDRIEDRYGPTPSIAYRQLQLYRKLNNSAAIEQTLQKLVAMDSSDVSSFQMLAEFYTEQERPDEARMTYERALAIEPGNLSLQLALAQLYRSAGDTQHAEALVRQSLEAEARSPEERLARARYLYNEARTDASLIPSALEVLERIVDTDPPSEEALLMQGELHLASGAYLAGGAAFYQALQLNPRSAIQWNRTAWAYLQGGMAGRAADLADEGLLLFPGNTELLRVAGFALLEVHRNDEAIGRFEELLRLSDEPQQGASISDVYAALGLLLDRKGEVDASDTYYERALTADPENAMAHNNFAYSLAARGIELKKARRHAEKALAANPDDPAYLDTLARVLRVSGNLAEALKVLDRAVNTRGASAAVYEHRGDVLQALGRRDEARQSWEKALQMNPSNPALEAKLAR